MGVSAKLFGDPISSSKNNEILCPPRRESDDPRVFDKIGPAKFVELVQELRTKQSGQMRFALAPMGDTHEGLSIL
jgi:hypothetical protein